MKVLRLSTTAIAAIAAAQGLQENHNRNLKNLDQSFPYPEIQKPK